MTKLGPPTVVAGGAIAYTLTVANDGPSDAANLTVTDTLPAGVTFVSATGTGWACGNAGNVSVTCTRPALAAGTTAPAVTVTVTAPAQATTLTNTATVASTTSDPDLTNNTSSVTTGVSALADLALSKTGPASVVAGTAVAYQLVVTDLGPSDAANVSVTDTLPAGVTFVSATGTGWACSNAGNVTVTCTRASVAAGATAPAITVTVTAPAQAAVLTNTAAVTSTTADPDVTNNTAGTTTTVTASADLGIVKTGPATVVAAGSVGYQLTVGNSGPSDAASVTVTDTLPAGVTFVSASGTGWACSNTGNVSVTCTRATIAAGTTAPVITLVVTAPAQGTVLSNTATVSSTTADPDPTDNTATATTTVTASADLSITKTGPATVVAAGSVAYTLTVANAGPSDATAVSVTDTLPAGVTFVSAAGTGWACSNAGNVSVTCTLPTLATGTSAPVITVTVTAPAQAATLTDTATVTSATADPDPANDTDSATTGVTASADLAITKTGPATVVAGSSATYQLSVTDNGPSDAASVSVTDTLPAAVTFVSATGAGWACSNAGNVSVTCTRASIAAGTTAPLVTVTVTAPAQAATLTDTATVTSPTPDPDPTNDTSSVTTTVTPSADLSVSKLGPPTVTAGGSVVYQVDVANAGPSDAAAVTVTDTLPAGVTFVSATGTGWACTNAGNVSVTCTRPTLAAGTSAPTITVTVTAPAQATTLTNTAAVASTTADPDLTDNTSSVTTGVTASADLGIAKTGPATVAADGAISYTLTVANAGPSDATGVLVADTLPAGVTFVSAAGTGWACSNAGNVSVTCTLATLAAGTTAPAITVTVTAPAQPGTLTNTAAVSATTSDPDPADNAASASTVVTPVADLAITKTGPATVTAGGALTYQLSVLDNGPSDATGVTVTDTLPAGVTFVSAAGTGWACSHAGNVSVTCTVAALAAGATAPVITVTVTAPAQAGSVTNTAAVTSAAPDPDPTNNTSSTTASVTASADLAITKTGPANVLSSSSISYVLTVTDNGPSDAAAVSVTDTLPAGVTFVSAAGTGWVCGNAGNVSVTCTRPSIAAGTTAPPISVVVTAPVVNGTLTNVADVSSATPDPDPTNDTASLSTDVGPAADVSITKTGPATAAPGSTVTYSLTVSNAGPSDATSVSVTDTLPAGVTFVSATGTGWACSSTGNVSVTCTRPTIVAGATAAVVTVAVAAPMHAATLTDTAIAANVVLDPDLGNNTATATTTVGAVADISLVKTGPPSVTVGGQVTYHLTVHNAGPDAAANLSVVDALPAGVTFVSATGTGWGCTHSGNVSVTCTRASLASGTSAPVITIVVTAPAVPASLANTAQVLATTFDPVSANNSSTAPTAVLAASGGGGGGGTGGGGSSGPLPHTGADGLGLVGLGLALVGAGLLLTAVTTRRGRRT